MCWITDEKKRERGKGEIERERKELELKKEDFIIKSEFFSGHTDDAACYLWIPISHCGRY